MSVLPSDEEEVGSHLDPDAYPHGRKLAVSGCNCKTCWVARVSDDDYAGDEPLNYRVGGHME